jgi:hypothetical protein
MAPLGKTVEDLTSDITDKQRKCLARSTDARNSAQVAQTFENFCPRGSKFYLTTPTQQTSHVVDDATISQQLNNVNMSQINMGSLLKFKR